MTIRRLTALAVASMSLAGLAACSSSAHASPAPDAKGTTCRTTRTGANVPVVIKIAKGAASCGAAMRAEQGYAAAVRGGELTGNGGGAPVKVGDWTCKGYPTPVVLRTGNASECHTASAEVVAVVELPPSSGG